ncbi:hypothetical protein [Streptomyces sp. NPDC096311]|uniref:hypothetical protein n=1 Tax=Streptomyces sp. NPDC096311 TaxID=3366083 RepID=UPI0037FB19D5
MPRPPGSPGTHSSTPSPKPGSLTALAAMSGMEREQIRDRTLEGHESARKRGKTIGGAGVTDETAVRSEDGAALAAPPQLQVPTN